MAARKDPLAGLSEQERTVLDLIGEGLTTGRSLARATAGTGFVAAAFMVVGREPTADPVLLAVAVMSLATTVVGLWAPWSAC